ncbi:hypothetical protein ABID26_000702 [Mesorhizobium shonense]|uniref:Transposase n=1 Tax=Mesorhizobium shonense TaxID=1209948 RepID=A0ABV2HL75_9HYPH|nr:hypothetical protein [Mesorhizobium sp.]TIS50624.1 MAG: hypothetical protein E5W96_10180 [Mesorhizobium sp.]
MAKRGRPTKEMLEKQKLLEELVRALARDFARRDHQIEKRLREPGPENKLPVLKRRRKTRRPN